MSDFRTSLQKIQLRSRYLPHDDTAMCRRIAIFFPSVWTWQMNHSSVLALKPRLLQPGAVWLEEWCRPNIITMTPRFREDLVETLGALCRVFPLLSQSSGASVLGGGNRR